VSGHQTRAERARMPLAREVVRAAAVQSGVCIRPVAVRKVDRVTGEAELVDLPCGATLASKCPSCARRARRLRIAQCREGWHLDAEPILQSTPPNTEQRTLATVRADLERARVDTDGVFSFGAVMANSSQPPLRCGNTAFPATRVESG